MQGSLSWYEDISADYFISALQLWICHLLPLTWKVKYLFAFLFVWYQLNRARLSPPVCSCVSAEMRSISLIYTKSDLAFKADKLSVLTQPFSEWSITICWLQHHIRSRTCLSVLVPVTVTHLVNFSYLASLHCSVSMYKWWIVMFINLHKRFWDTGMKCTMLILRIYC